MNVTWTPISQLDLVLEFLTGRRVNRDGARGVSSQVQAGWTFRFEGGLRRHALHGPGALPDGDAPDGERCVQSNRRPQ
jgi:hypothetical protein